MVAAADRMLTTDVEGSTISLSYKARRRFFAAPAGAAAAASPADRAVAYVLYRLEGAIAIRETR